LTGLEAHLTRLAILYIHICLANGLGMTQLGAEWTFECIDNNPITIFFFMKSLFIELEVPLLYGCKFKNMEATK
jgi:hypothetical protein